MTPKPRFFVHRGGIHDNLLSKRYNLAHVARLMNAFNAMIDVLYEPGARFPSEKPKKRKPAKRSE